LGKGCLQAQGVSKIVSWSSVHFEKFGILPLKNAGNIPAHFHFSGQITMIGTDQAIVGATKQGRHAAPGLSFMVLGCFRYYIHFQKKKTGFETEEKPQRLNNRILGCSIS
jgi:hypothetical protein